MNNEYTASEVIEIGNAQELILGAKSQTPELDSRGFKVISDVELDD